MTLKLSNQRMLENKTWAAGIIAELEDLLVIACPFWLFKQKTITSNAWSSDHLKLIVSYLYSNSLRVEQATKSVTGMQQFFRSFVPLLTWIPVAETGLILPTGDLHACIYKCLLVLLSQWRWFMTKLLNSSSKGNLKVCKKCIEIYMMSWNITHRRKINKYQAESSLGILQSLLPLRITY